MPEKSLKGGMSSSNNRQHVRDEQVVNKRSSDPFDRLIYEKGLRIQRIMTDKKLNTMLVLLNNGEALKVPVDYFEILNKATQSELDNWELSGDGTGLRWKDLDEDLSLKGLIKDSALLAMLHRLEAKDGKQELSVL